MTQIWDQEQQSQEEMEQLTWVKSMEKNNGKHGHKTLTTKKMQPL